MRKVSGKNVKGGSRGEGVANWPRGGGIRRVRNSHGNPSWAPVVVGDYSKVGGIGSDHSKACQSATGGVGTRQGRN